MEHMHESCFGNEIYCDYISWLKKLNINAYFIRDLDPDKYVKLTRLTLNITLKHVLSEVTHRYDSSSIPLLWCVGFTPPAPLVKADTVCEHYCLDEHFNVFKGFILRHFIHTTTSKTIYFKLLHRGIRPIYLPPVVSNNYYHDNGRHLDLKLELEWLIPYIECADIRLLYMGPLLPKRFPIELIVPLLNTLKKKGMNAILVAITTPRSRLSIMYYNELVYLIRRYNMERNLILKLMVLKNDLIKYLIFRKFDALLYIPVKPVMMSDPPLTVLEAMSSGLPPIISAFGDLAHLITIYGAGEVVKPLFSAVNIYDSVRNIIERRKMYSKNAKRLIREKYSLEAVAKRAEMLLKLIN